MLEKLQSVKVYSRADFSSYCVMSIWFGCNNRCTICMLSEVQQTLSGLAFNQFKEVTTNLAQEGRYRNLILSGGALRVTDARARLRDRKCVAPLGGGGSLLRLDDRGA